MLEGNGTRLGDEATFRTVKRLTERDDAALIRNFRADFLKRTMNSGRRIFPFLFHPPSIHPFCLFLFFSLTALYSKHSRWQQNFAIIMQFSCALEYACTEGNRFGDRCPLGLCKRFNPSVKTPLKTLSLFLSLSSPYPSHTQLNSRWVLANLRVTKSYIFNVSFTSLLRSTQGLVAVVLVKLSPLLARVLKFSAPTLSLSVTAAGPVIISPINTAFGSPLSRKCLFQNRSH